MIPRTKSCACGHAGMHHGENVGCALCPCVKFAHPSTRPVPEGVGVQPARGRHRHGRVLRSHPTRDAPA